MKLRWKRLYRIGTKFENSKFLFANKLIFSRKVRNFRIFCSCFRGSKIKKTKRYFPILFVFFILPPCFTSLARSPFASAKLCYATFARLIFVTFSFAESSVLDSFFVFSMRAVILWSKSSICSPVKCVIFG